jgi:exodeoxyribonuclease VII large subunit
MEQSLFEFKPQRKIYSVSDLTEEIRAVFEDQFPDVWVTGEISNYRPAASGHCYFTLKDAKAQLRAVCFRNQARYLKFKPADGLAVIARGQLSIYEARGEYQLIVEFLEPAGLGALQLAFEQLKAKLAAEGLFALERKRSLPLLPRTVGIVTSPTGAVIRDMLRVLRRRFRNLNVVLYPVRVQGEGAADEIALGIQCLNRQPSVDVIIVARGGGSLEDLWAFNEEHTARAIAASNLPVISAVGHETDFTISDFVADLRAPTPSAAAELVVHRRQDFEAEIGERLRRLGQEMRLRLSEARRRFAELQMHRVFQTLGARVAARGQRVDESTAALGTAMSRHLSAARQAWLQAAPGVMRYDFARLLKLRRSALEQQLSTMQTAVARGLDNRGNRLSHVRAMLGERNPLTILQRGYSITRNASGRIVRDAQSLAAGSEISVRLARGEMGATVRSVKP